MEKRKRGEGLEPEKNDTVGSWISRAALRRAFRDTSRTCRISYDRSKTGRGSCSRGSLRSNVG